MGAVKIINTHMWHRFQGCGLLALDTVLVFIFLSKPNLEHGLLWSKMGPPSDSCFSFENYITTD
ncbi:hypothetical protein Peur_044139 [Populus x canadensis]